MSSSFALEARNIEKSFPGVKALDGVSLAVASGEVHALVGENGAGKSTLMLVFGGIHRPEGGEILLDGKRVVFESAHDANQKGISVVYQELSIAPGLSIAENIFAHRQPVRGPNLVDWRELHRKTTDLLALFNMDHLNPGMLVRQLSMADQQVVEILKAISFDPKVLILDEPTSSLTEVEVKKLFRNIRVLKEKGIACIYISHHLPELFEIGDRVTVLRDGKYVCTEKVQDIDENFLVSKMVGRTLANIYGRREPKDTIGDIVFKAKGLTKHGEFQDVSFAVRRGEIVTLAGLIGAGRTEVGRAIFGAEVLQEGELYLNGVRIRVPNPQAAIRQGIGYVTEDRRDYGLYHSFSVERNVVANHLNDFAGAMGFMNTRKIRKFAQDLVQRFRVATPGIDQKVGKLSGGNQQKVLVSAWFGIEPRLLIVDEPTRGVDVGAKSEIYDFIRALARSGVAILMISSDLNEVLGMSDRIVVMRTGQVAGELKGQDATEESVIGLASGVEAKS
jgi:ABC-type sugar transport system ATPase subunit